MKVQKKDNSQQCTRCVMDTTSKLIEFDSFGICNFCKHYEEDLQRIVYQYSRDEHQLQLKLKVNRIKEEGENSKYDCILGISGGMDSSYLCILAKEWGLRPLVVHFDNGWNSDLAVTNINNIIRKLGFDLYTYVINWEQFKDLQLAYFKASVLDIEVPNDQLIFAVLFKVAKENNIKNIISGNNIFTEHILPQDWAFHQKFDLTNLRNIHKKFGQVNIRNFPSLSLRDRLKYKKEGYKIHTVFEHLDYNYTEVRKRLSHEFSYVFYECKHFESIFTRFYQGYILPRKWNIDKRKAHYSCLIMCNQMTREEALERLKLPPYSMGQQLLDKQYLLKKWGITEDEFESVMKKPPVAHSVYGFDKGPLLQRLIGKVSAAFRR
jgi:N-acetyl sugar amidotransferase